MLKTLQSTSSTGASLPETVCRDPLPPLRESAETGSRLLASLLRRVPRNEISNACGLSSACADQLCASECWEGASFCCYTTCWVGLGGGDFPLHLFLWDSAMC